MIRQAPLPHLMLVACLLLSGGARAVGQENPSAPAAASAPAPAAYRIRASEVVVPEGVPLGQYRRVTTPFENWTLVCDENLKAKQMVCNVSQVIEDRSGALVFSWSLAATQEGKPFMILRTAPQADPNGEISLGFSGRKQPVAVRLEGCNQAVCVGMVPVGPVLREQIGKEAPVTVSYAMASGERVTVTASLKGLAKALGTIN
nr:invasion associated locus B family protein [Ancylobacter moscoviensis]